MRFGLRDYEPATGRWTSRDPILHAGGMNLYVYAEQRPRRPPRPDRHGRGLAAASWASCNSVGEFFTDGDGGTAVEVVSSIDSDSPIVEGAGKLSEGMDKLETIQDVAETALEVNEALDEPTDPEQAAGLLKCGLKWIKKILPVDLDRRPRPPSRRSTRAWSTPATSATRHHQPRRERSSSPQIGID